MFARARKLILSVATQNACMKFSTTSQRNFKVAVTGAAGGVGQPLSLLLKQNYLVTHLALHDNVPIAPGVAIDLSHIDTQPEVSGFMGPGQLADAVENSDVVVIATSVPIKVGMTRDDVFLENAPIVRDIAGVIAKTWPKAIVVVVTNPINHLVPLVSEVLRMEGVYDPNRVLGVTTLDVIRACTLIGQINRVDPMTVKVPVIGGHSGVTAIPLLSQSQPAVKVSSLEQIEQITRKIQNVGSEIIRMKGDAATLSLAHAAGRFISSVLKGLSGEPNIEECAYVKADLTIAPYFANPVILGTGGVHTNLGFGSLNEYEQKLLNQALPQLLSHIEIGESYIRPEPEEVV